MSCRAGCEHSTCVTIGAINGSSSRTGSGISNSFIDLMTSLAVIFILLLCASLNNAQQQSETTRNSVLAEYREP